MANNRLDEIMNAEALSNSELAKLSGLSERTISTIRRKKKNGSPTTQNKILKALNQNPDKLDKQKPYILEDIFPQKK